MTMALPMRISISDSVNPRVDATVTVSMTNLCEQHKRGLRLAHVDFHASPAWRSTASRICDAHHPQMMLCWTSKLEPQRQGGLCDRSGKAGTAGKVMTRRDCT